MEQNNFFIFSFIITFFILSYYLFTTKLIKINRKCKCEICDAFITCSWKQKFTNLPDWITYLLKNSPSKTIHIHVLNNIITANPANVEYILKTNFDNYPKGKPTLAILGDLLGHGIFNVDSDHWRFQRKLASLELGSNSIRAYAHQVLACEITGYLINTLDRSKRINDDILSKSKLDKSKSTNDVILSRGGGHIDTLYKSKSINDNILSRGGPEMGLSGELSVLDLQEVFRNFSYNNICKFSFGVDPTGLPGLDKAFDVASNLSAARALNTSSFYWRVKRVFSVGSEKSLRAAIGKVNVLATSIIKGNRENNVCVNKGNLLSRFMGRVDDDKYLRDIVVNFLLAGRDTNASGLTTLFYLLTRHPEVEARIIEESNKVMGLSKTMTEARSLRVATVEELREMHYLQATIHESLRLFPPVQMDSKFANDSDVLPDLTRVESGNRVAYHPYAMGRMEDIWGPDCLEFRPERWLDSVGRFKPENPFKYTVFQGGVRVCLGKDLALLVMKAAALAVVRRFEIKLADPNWVPRFIPGLTATLKGGMPIIVKDRQ